MTMRRVAVICGVVGVIALGVLSQLDRGQAIPEEPEFANQEQIKAFEYLLRLDERFQFEAFVTGDVSRFATIYYNDSTVDLNDEYRAQIEQAGNVTNEIVASLTGGPKGSGSGFLSAQVAGFTLYDANATAWESVLATASVSGKNPSMDKMPGQAEPFERKVADEWVDTPFYLFDVLVSNSHATAMLTYAEPEKAEIVLHYTFTKVDGQWYISGLSGGPPSMPIDPQTTPYVTLASEVLPGAQR